MLHAKSKDHKTSGSDEDTLYGCGGHLGHVTWISYINFLSHFPLRIHITFGFKWPGGFREEDLRKWLANRRMDA